VRGRIRTVKPELFKDEELWDLHQATGLPVTQAFIGLWCYADREGRFEWKPRQLKSDILPYWDGDFGAVLDELASRSFIVRYIVDGRDYGYIRTFGKHQVINNKEQPSTLPARDGHAMGTREARVAVQENPFQGEGKGREGNGKGVGSGSTDARTLPSNDTDPPKAPDPAPAITGQGVVRTYTMPSADPPKEYLDEAAMRSVPRAQAVSTWKHYRGAGLPERGVERLYEWLCQRATERLNATVRSPPSTAHPNPKPRYSTAAEAMADGLVKRV